MGGCSSPWFAEITIEALELNALQKLKSSNVFNKRQNCFSNPPLFSDDVIIFYKRFVNDVLLIAKEDSTNIILDKFNSFHPDIQFTIELETNKKISFLNVEIHRKHEQAAVFNWYRKDTYSGRYINFLSHHPISQKMAPCSSYFKLPTKY